MHVNRQEKYYDIKDYELWENTANTLKGSWRRQFMAKVVALLGRGRQRLVESLFGWNRTTIRKGQKELETGVEIIDRFHDRGRK